MFICCMSSSSHFDAKNNLHRSIHELGQLNNSYVVSLAALFSGSKKKNL